MRVSVPEVQVGPESVARLLEQDGSADMKEKPGLYANIRAKRERIATGSGEHMRRTGSRGAPTPEAFRESAKTVKTVKKKTRK